MATLKTSDEAPAPDPVAPTERQAENVIEALVRVVRDLPAIAKDQTASAAQGGYAYRGIEQITQHAQRLFARHGVLFGVPRVVGWEIRDIVVGGKPWMDVIEEIEYDVYGPGGIADRITVGPILAIGRDNSDKGANKCLTQAYKYALLQVLTISDAKDDADGSTHERDTSAPPPDPGLVARDEAARRIKALPDEPRSAVREYCTTTGIPVIPAEWDDSQLAAVMAHVDSLPAPEDPAPAATTPPQAPRGPSPLDALEAEVISAAIEAVRALDVLTVEDQIRAADKHLTGIESTDRATLAEHYALHGIPVFPPDPFEDQ